MLVPSQKPLSFNADFRPETDKTQQQLGQVIVGDAPVLSHCSLLINHLPKPTGVLEHCH
jgi:hypothetical protein